MVPKDHQWEWPMGNHMTDDGSYASKGQVVIPIRLEPNILKTAGDAMLFCNNRLQHNML